MRKRVDASSVMNSAMPRLSGTANAIAIADDTSVPKMKASAPNCAPFGFQRSLVTKLKPCSRNAGHALLVVVYAINPKTTSTSSPATRATTRNARSLQMSPPLGRSVAATPVMRVTLRRDLELAQLCVRLLLQGVRQLGVVGGLGEVLGVVQHEREEVLQRLALHLVGLLGVRDDPGRRGERVRAGARSVERAVAEVVRHGRAVDRSLRALQGRRHVGAGGVLDRREREL